jgi:hypothetical protein
LTKKVESRFLFLSMQDNLVKIREFQKHKVHDLYFKHDGVHCSTCNTDMCEHMLYALTLPVVQKEVARKIKAGWNLPETDM